MFRRRIIYSFIISLLLIAAINSACSRSEPPVPANTSATITTELGQTQGIEVEIVTPQAIAGSISATGKILVADTL